MSEQTRMSKYKDLRDNIDDDMSYVLMKRMIVMMISYHLFQNQIIMKV